MNERLRHQDQNPLRPSAAEQPVHDQARLDGFSKPHLIRQQHPRQKARGHLVRDRELVGDEVDARAHEAAHWGVPDLVPAAQAFEPEVKRPGAVHLAGHEPVLRLAEAESIGEIRLQNLPPAAVINEHPGLAGFHGLDEHRLARVGLDRIARAELHAFDRRRGRGVLADSAAGAKKQRNPAR